MNEILGYGEDAFTLWALKKRMPDIVLPKLNDQSYPSDCLIFYRPSFGRSGGEGSPQFGEFDAILASSKNVYLIESKWDNFRKNKKDEIKLTKAQILRHKIFSWYHLKWVAQQYSDWDKFRNAKQNEFKKEFSDKPIPRQKDLLAQNLWYVLKRLKKHGKRFSCEYGKPRNVLLYFHWGESKKIKEKGGVIPDEKKLEPDIKKLDFKVVNIDYSEYISRHKDNKELPDNNFITL